MKLKNLLKNKILHYSIICAFAILFCSFESTAQSTSVKGIVTDNADNTPLPGVSVLVKGTSRGTNTDFDKPFLKDKYFNLKFGSGDLRILCQKK